MRNFATLRNIMLEDPKMAERSKAYKREPDHSVKNKYFFDGFLLIAPKKPQQSQENQRPRRNLLCFFEK